MPRTLAAAVLAAAVLGLGARPSWALVDCSGTAGTTSAAIPLPGGAVTRHIEITNPAQNTAQICVNPTGAAAVCGASGNVTIAPGGDRWWDFPDLPSAPSVVASAASTPYQCDYR